MTRTAPHDVEFRLDRPEKNVRRVYGLTPTHDLFGVPCLVIVWGRRGTRAIKRRTEAFRSDDELARRWRALVARRRRRGYEEITADRR